MRTRGRLDRRRAWQAWRSLIPIILTVLTACGEPGEPEPGVEASAEVASSRIERGPVRVTAEVVPKKARLSDEPVLTVTIEHEKGVTVRKPPFGEAIGDFLIRRFEEPLPRVEGDREVLRQIYTLEPTRTGELSILPIAVTFVDTRPEGDGAEHTVETEGLRVEVASVAGTEIPSLDELRPPEGPVPIPEAGNRTVLWLGALVVVGAGALFWVWRRRRRGVTPEKVLTPSELAYLEMQELLESGLVDQDIKVFYVELTGIVRRFIERTKGIRAPEETTEEFLREIQDGVAFSASERERLRGFLESADLVKFAAFTPGRGEIEESFRRAKVFIGLEREEGLAA